MAAVLYHAASPLPLRGFALDLRDSCLQPPDFSMTPEEYLGSLRVAFKRHPRPFLDQARAGKELEVVLYSRERPDLARVLYDAVVRVAASRGWRIAGGEQRAEPVDAATQRRRLYANRSDVPADG